MSNLDRNKVRFPLWIYVALLLSTVTFAKDGPRDSNVGGSQKISIGNFVFKPATLEISAGSKVTWVNEDDVPHTVVGTDAASPVKSPALDTEDRYSITFDKPGVYKYFCSLHPHMTGVLIVK